jgi:hypothetical protein
VDDRLASEAGLLSAKGRKIRLPITGTTGDAAYLDPGRPCSGCSPAREAKPPTADNEAKA